MQTNNDKLIFGVDSFGDVLDNPETNQPENYEAALEQIVKEAKLADDLGIDVIALGEHHRPEYAISSPEMVLAAIATVTKKIKLSTGVTVLSSDDPVRVYERFATLDNLSHGRAQIMLGRGSFAESFPLFGYDLDNYNELFEEKVALFNKLLEGGPVTWKSKFTQNLKNVELYPKINGHKLETYIGVGGTPESILRAAYYGFPVILAIIGGDPVRFKPLVELYQKAAAKYDNPQYPLGMHSHGVIAESDEKAYAVGWKYLRRSMDRIGADRGWPPMTKERFDYEIKEGSYYIGTPEHVAHKIAAKITKLGVKRFDFIYGAGGQYTTMREQSLRLYGKKVVPMVKDLIKSGQYQFAN
ncbi:LLM class flavin-dependent oxidoreductase [Lactobacillus sp. ESL0791]|uniref:LLM class flavin-dependent oxidoreductase n=1 Tax=Lactobacillus sp. ESL0791 TaxID=2983234 RepID=UPI0023F64A61|nr:LLM class flavin-dependent oxidoreductase [Lactobacillus sp. ESL0791]MDF7639412.1 LLM class flavin-dependent oxidoreductase [Lactobacillus sp. ESL0791]